MSILPAFNIHYSCLYRYLFVFYRCLVVALSSVDLIHEYFGKRMNLQPIAIYDIPDPSDKGKALAEFYKDMDTLALRGINFKGHSDKKLVLHNAFLKGHLGDAVARYY
jgi:hypothetical protein